MTADPSLISPSGTHPDGEVFRSPVTRSLLAHSGYTTPVLEAIAGADLDIRVITQHATCADLLSPAVAAALEVSGHDRVLLRRSELVDGTRTVSLNLVFAVCAPAALYGVDDATTPIGKTLMARGARQRRRILSTGLSRWPDGRACAAHVYVMVLDDKPVCWIRECFSPDVVSAERADAARCPTWDDDPS